METETAVTAELSLVFINYHRCYSLISWLGSKTVQNDIADLSVLGFKAEFYHVSYSDDPFPLFPSKGHPTWEQAKKIGDESFNAKRPTEFVHVHILFQGE